MKEMSNLSSLELFYKEFNSHVEIPFESQKGFVDLILQLRRPLAVTKPENLLMINNPEIWHPFNVPLHIYIVTCIEVFLENFFFEKNDKYSNMTELKENFDAFKKDYDWKEKNGCIHRGLSFQKTIFS